MSDDPNYTGAVEWYIVAAAEHVTIPGFTFSVMEAPYLMIKTSTGLLVFNRETFLEMLAAWNEAARGVTT